MFTGEELQKDAVLVPFKEAQVYCAASPQSCQNGEGLP